MFYKEKHAKFEVYNDADSQLVNLFRCIKHHCGELQREIDGYMTSREMFEDIKARIDMRGFTDIQRASMFYVQIRASFGADIRTFGCNNRNISKMSGYLTDIQERLKNVVIENKDFENLIKVYDRPNALIYCDPPYYTAEKYYDADFTEADHLRLKNCLDGVKGKFVLSYNDCGFVRELYKDYIIIGVERQNNLSSGVYREVVVRNY